MVQGDSSDGEDEEGRGAQGEGDVDMQVTFDSGLETLGERLASKKSSKAAETLWQAYEKRRRYSPTPDHNLTTAHPLWHVLINLCTRSGVRRSYTACCKSTSDQRKESQLFNTECRAGAASEGSSGKAVS